MEKICGFYVSNVHLITMILPYLSNQIKKGVKIETFFQEDLTENINTILNNLIINKEEKENILNINWKSNKLKKYIVIENNLKIIDNTNIIIFVSGNKDYINEVNNILNRFFEKNKNYNIKIINCFEVSTFDDNIQEILTDHEYILNTSGIHKIEDVLDNNQKRIAN